MPRIHFIAVNNEKNYFIVAFWINGHWIVLLILQKRIFSKVTFFFTFPKVINHLFSVCTIRLSGTPALEKAILLTTHTGGYKQTPMQRKTIKTFIPFFIWWEAVWRQASEVCCGSDAAPQKIQRWKVITCHRNVRLYLFFNQPRNRHWERAKLAGDCVTLKPKALKVV